MCSMVGAKPMSPPFPPKSILPPCALKAPLRQRRMAARSFWRL